MPKQTNQLMELRFPVGGLNRQSGFDMQPPYTTPYCFNVRPYDVVNLTSAEMHGMRQRGGARPGIVKFYSAGSQPQNGHPHQLLTYASAVGTDGVADNLLVAITDGSFFQNSSGAMVRVGSANILNQTATQLRGTQVGEKFYVADFRPANVTGANGTIASTNRLSDPAISDWTALSPAIDTSKDYVYIAGNVDTEANVYPITTVTSGYIVITGTMTNQSGGAVWQIGRPPKVFDPKSPTSALTNLMGSYPIPNTNYRAGTVTSVNGTVNLTGGSWASVPTPDANNQVTLEIPNSTGIGTQQYLVASKTDNDTVVLNNQTSDADCTGVTYVISWKSDYYGVPPLNCPLCCTYRGRLVLAGPGSVWYMSRVLDPNDWDYGFDPSDPARAVAGTSTTTGGIAEPILALMPHSDDYLIFGCERSLWILNGDPAYGGTITALSRDVGVLGPSAWCNLPDSSIVLLSRDGLYHIPAGGSSYPQPISREKLPNELINVDWINNTISLCYDVEARGIHLSITPTDGSAGVHFFIDWTIRSFWPVVFADDDFQPTAMVRYASGSSVSSLVVLGGFDGYLRYYSATAVNDDGTAFASLVAYGPFRIGGPGYYGEILQISADLDTNGQGASWGIYKGDSAEAAVQEAVTAGDATSASWTGTLAAGTNHRQFVRAYGAALLLVFGGSYGWAIEGARIEGKRKGPIR